MELNPDLDRRAHEPVNSKGNGIYMSRIERAINIDDLKQMAKRRLPKIMFDFIEGGVEDEVGIRTNASAFRDLRLVPRYYVDTSSRDQRTALFDRTYASPFGIAPTGMAGAFRRDAELYLSQAAAQADVPYLMSGASNASMEEGAKLAGKNLWYQIYGARDRSIASDLAKRNRLRSDHACCDLRRPGIVESRTKSPQWLRPTIAHEPANHSRSDAAPGLGNQLLPHWWSADAGQLATIRNEGCHT